MKVRLVSLLSAVLVVAGCGMFKSRDIPYQDSVNQSPLQVPEDLDQPLVDDTLRIPEGRVEGSRDIRVVDGAAAPAITGDVVLSDSLEGAWRRVGLALSRLGDDVAVVDSDEAAGRYRVEVAVPKQRTGFLRRMFRRGAATSNERVIVQLEAVESGVRVRTVESNVAARVLLERLRQRLG